MSSTSKKEDETKEDEIIVEEISSAREIAPLKWVPGRRKEVAAMFIALILVGGFLLLLFFPFFLLLKGLTTVAEATDLMKTVSAILSGTIGAVLGYYYRIAQEKD